MADSRAALPYVCVFDVAPCELIQHSAWLILLVCLPPCSELLFWYPPTETCAYSCVEASARRVSADCGALAFGAPRIQAAVRSIEVGEAVVSRSDGIRCGHQLSLHDRWVGGSTATRQHSIAQWLSLSSHSISSSKASSDRSSSAADMGSIVWCIFPSL